MSSMIGSSSGSDDQKHHHPLRVTGGSVQQSQQSKEKQHHSQQQQQPVTPINFRTKFYYAQLGFQGVNMKAIEALLTDSIIDLTRLKEFCLKCPLSNQLRATIYKLLIGVLPTCRKSWKFVMRQLREEFEDIYGTMLVIQPDLFVSQMRRSSVGVQRDDDESSSNSCDNDSTTVLSTRVDHGEQQVTAAMTNSVEEYAEHIFALYKVYRLLLSDIREKPRMEKEYLAVLSSDEERNHILQMIKLLIQTCDVVAHQPKQQQKQQQQPKQSQHKTATTDRIRIMSETYWSFSKMMEKYFGTNYTHWGDTVYYLTNDLMKFIESFDPYLFSIVNNQETGHKMKKMFAGWFCSLFGSFLTTSKTLRLWDCILLFPIEFVSYVAQAYVRRISAKIHHDNPSWHNVISHPFYYLQIEEHEVDPIIQSALNEMNVAAKKP